MHRKYTKEESSKLTLSQLIPQLAVEYKDHDAFVFKDEFRTYRYTYSEIYNHSKKLANYFVKQGIKKGDKVIIWSYNSPNWIVVFFACIISGIIPVPLDFNATKEFVKKVSEITNAKLIFSSRYKESKLNHIVIEDILKIVVNYSTDFTAIDANPDDIFEILYTSGTTSEPKGVILKHQNVISNIHSLRRIMKPIKRGSYLSIIPLSHILEQTIGLFIPLLFGYKITYISSRKSSLIEDAISSEKINVIVTVPAFLKIIKIKIQSKIEESGQVDKFEKLFKYPDFIKSIILRNKIPLIKDLRYFLVGGAPLGLEVEEFWNKLGIITLQGYGLTETAPIISSNSENERKVGTVGKILPLQKVRFGTDKEILFKGNNLFSGYYHNEEATKESFTEDGWYKTGDLGEIDKDGFLKIIGRKKNMILTDTGLNIYPEDIEKEFNKVLEVKDTVVLGINENDKTITTAVVILKSNIDSLLLKEQVNNNLNSSQKVQKIIVWDKEDFPRTSSLKVKRNILQQIIEDFQENSQDQLEVNPQEEYSDFFKILAQIADVPINSIKNNQVLYSDLNIDSIRRVELVSIIEETFDVELNESDITEKTTVTEVDTLIQKTNQNLDIKDFNYWSFSPLVLPIRAVLQKVAFAYTKLFYSIKITGLKNLDSIKAPVIFVMNHTSHLDTITLLRALPLRYSLKIAPAAAHDYFFGETNSIKKNLIRIFLQLGVNIFPFSRTNKVKKSFKRVGTILDKGYNILLFPEGTRSTTGTMTGFLNGIGLIASQMNVPIVPIKSEGLFEILPKGATHLKKGSAKIKIGKQFIVDSNKPIQKIVNEIENSIREL